MNKNCVPIGKLMGENSSKSGKPLKWQSRAKARKGKGLDMAMGWAWLNVHDRTESDAWRFDEASRDKGGDWVPALQALWDAASELLLNDNLDAAQDYESSMNWLAEVSGAGPINP